MIAILSGQAGKSYHYWLVPPALFVLRAEFPRHNFASIHPNLTIH
jgi:hypothetical protein